MSGIIYELRIESDDSCVSTNKETNSRRNEFKHELRIE